MKPFLNKQYIIAFVICLVKEGFSTILCTFFEDETIQILMEDVYDSWEMYHFQWKMWIRKYTKLISLLFIFNMHNPCDTTVNVTEENLTTLVVV